MTQRKRVGIECLPQNYKSHLECMKIFVANKSKCILPREYNYGIKEKHCNDRQEIRNYYQVRHNIHRFEKFEDELDEAKCLMNRCTEYQWKAKKIHDISKTNFMDEMLNKDQQDNYQLFYFGNITNKVINSIEMKTEINFVLFKNATNSIPTLSG